MIFNWNLHTQNNILFNSSDLFISVSILLYLLEAVFFFFFYFIYSTYHHFNKQLIEFRFIVCNTLEKRKFKRFLLLDIILFRYIYIYIITILNILKGCLAKGLLNLFFFKREHFYKNHSYYYSKHFIDTLTHKHT